MSKSNSYLKCAMLCAAMMFVTTVFAVPDDNASVEVNEEEWEGEMLLTIPMKSPQEAGDANGDGIINVKDIVATVNYIMTLDMTNLYLSGADANRDGVVNKEDVETIAKMIVEKK